MLDSGSTATFCDVKLMKNLNRRLNVSKDALTTQGDVSGLAYLQGVDLPRMIGHGKVSLLIGADVLEALEPVEVR